MVLLPRKAIQQPMIDFHGIPADTGSDHGGFDLAIPEQWRPARSHEGHRICNTSIQWVTAKKNQLTMTGHPPSVITAAVFDTKPYDRQALQQVSANHGIEWHFLEFRLTEDTASAARNAGAVCVFVNDQLDRSCLRLLARQGVELVALRCAGFNNVDIEAAKELGLTVTRVPIYSPHAVAEHAVALLLTLNRKIHRAFNRVRELNFSLNGLVGFDLHG